MPSINKLDRALAAAALRKQQAGEAPSARERSALNRVEKAHEEERRWEYYRTIPQKHWREMSGRQAKTINEQAATYNIPFSGASIDLPAVVRALHDFLAANKYKLARTAETDPLLMGEDSPALERYRMAKARLAEKDLEIREKTHVNISELDASLRRFSSALRRTGEALKRRFGSEAAEMYNSAIDEAERAITSDET